MNSETVNILFVWTGITRFAGDCWRTLASLPGVKLSVAIHAPRNAALEADVLHGISYAIVEDGEPVPQVEKPDVLFVVGWHSPVVRHYVELAEWAEVPKVFCFDMPWRNSWRCVAARFVLWRYLRKFRLAFVPGASGARYARWLGFRTVVQGFLAVDLGRFSVPRKPNATGFIYVGRNSPEKRLDVLQKAYVRYRELGGTWGIEYHHTTPYSQLPSCYASHACLVMASSHDPWPLVVLEALAAGCEAIISDRCMNKLELPARVVKCGDVQALANEMLAVEHGERRPEGVALDFWDARRWAERVMNIVKEVTV